MEGVWGGVVVQLEKYGWPPQPGALDTSSAAPTSQHLARFVFVSTYKGFDENPSGCNGISGVVSTVDAQIKKVHVGDEVGYQAHGSWKKLQACGFLVLAAAYCFGEGGPSMCNGINITTSQGRRLSKYGQSFQNNAILCCEKHKFLSYHVCYPLLLLEEPTVLTKR